MIIKSTNIIWDFDGVIIDSDKVRTNGFRHIFRNFSKKDVNEIIKYHKTNGGLSRYVKIKYFFDSILKVELRNNNFKQYLSEYSAYMKVRLIDNNLLINQTIEFIKKSNKKNMFLVSASDQEELIFLTKKLSINNFFKEIKGSPTSKHENIKNLILKFGIDKTDTVLIGDSINDFEAAKKNGIKFIGFNNTELNKKNINYLEKFDI
tara:strand:- start:445 stop:1062 length:618 start_codon:yes stop_codon:yes gene_type:complete